MTRAGNKVPFPMPQSGVVADQHPFAVSTGQLVRSQNWLNEDGIFRTRDGLISVDPPKRWYEALSLLDNLVPMGLAEGDASGLSMLGYDNTAITVTVESDNSPFGDQQYRAELTGSDIHDHHAAHYDFWITTVIINIDPGLPYTGWVFSGEDTEDGDIVMEFMDSDDQVIESHDLAGDAVVHGLWEVTETSPPQTTGVRFKFYPRHGAFLYFGPMKISQGPAILAWTHGDGYSGTPDENLFDVEIAHPYDTQKAIDAWAPISGRETFISYQGGQTLGLFDDYTVMPVLGRATGFSCQPKQLLPSIDERLGLELNEDYWAEVTAGAQYYFSASYFFDYEQELIADMKYLIEMPFYDADGNEITTRTIFTSLPVQSGTSIELTSRRGRFSTNFYAPALATHAGLRIVCVCPTADREIVYDSYGEIVYELNGSIVTIESENLSARRVGYILDDVKFVAAYGADPRWWDFVLPTVTHTGPYGNSEYPLNYLPHEYLYEGTTEANRIIQATDQSLWKWNDTTDLWDWIGFDLATIATAWYLQGTDADTGETSYTVDDRFSFEIVGDGYTAGTGEDETLTVEVMLPSASADSESPEPGGYWKYRVNSGDWSSQFNLTGETPVLQADIEYNSRSIGVRIVLSVTDNDDFSDECTIPEDYEEDWPEVIFEGTIVSRKHDGQTGETLFHADRDNAVDLRGYDFAQRTYIICANKNDRVVAWDGQSDSKAERCGSNAPYAKTICISGGRVLAGNVQFDDPYSDLNAPLAVVYSDTFLSRGFRNWHPELAIRLADTPGEVIKLMEMGTLAVAAYKTDAVYMLVYQTGNNPFRTQLMASSVPGPCSVRAVAAQTENTHLYIGEDGGLYLFDGSYPRPLAQSISLTIANELDLSYKDRVFLAYSPRLRAALAMYPTKGSNGSVNRGMWIDIDGLAGWPFEWDLDYFDFTAGAPVQTVDSYEMGGVTMRLGHVDTPLASGQSLQPDFFMGAYDGTTYVMDETAPNDWGQPVLAHFRSGLTEFGLGSRYSVLKEIELMMNRANTPHSMEVSVWASQYGTDAKVVTAGDVDIFADGPYELEVREKARFFGYGVLVQAYEQLQMNGAWAAVRALGHR